MVPDVVTVMYLEEAKKTKLKKYNFYPFFNIIYTFLGSIFEPCYIQNRVITNHVIKSLLCI